MENKQHVKGICESCGEGFKGFVYGKSLDEVVCPFSCGESTENYETVSEVDRMNEDMEIKTPYEEVGELKFA